MIYLINPPSDFLLDDKSNMPLGLLFLHAHLVRNGVEVEIVDLAGQSEEKWIIPDNGDVYGITATTPQFEAACKISGLIKDQNKDSLVVLGGVHGTCAAADSMLYGFFDAVVVGEGEHTFLEMLRNKTWANVPGLWYMGINGPTASAPRIFEKNIDNFEHPRIDSIDYESYHCGVFTTDDGDMVRGAQIITSRGCPSNCSFCCSPFLYKRKVRFHSPEYIDSWVNYLNDFGYNNFYVVDDTVLLKPSRLEGVCNVFKKYNSRWRACIRGDAATPKNMKMLYDSGCRQVDIGVETGSQKILDLMQKGEKVEDNAKAIKLAHEVGIKVKSCLIVGLPGETQEDVDLTVDFVNENSPDSVTLCTFIPFPGCDIFLNPEKYNYQIDPHKGYSKYVCCGVDAMVESVAIDETNERIAFFRKQLLDAIQSRSTNVILRERKQYE